ncbi:MAG: polyphosphate kinase 1 [Bacteroidota bacterium]|jgi:polyphosphate kinase
MKQDELLIVNRDISWLSFNDRVLQEANDPSVPLMERLKFLGIVSSNRDEFFRVRVASIKRMVRLGKKGEELLGENPIQLLDSIQNIIVRQQEEFDDSFQRILSELERKGIFLLNENQLTKDQGAFVRDYFYEHVQPALVPILLDNLNEFPAMKDRSIYFLIMMQKAGSKTKFALLEIPSDVISRFVVIPKESKYIILLDDVIRYCLDDLFFNFDYDAIRAFTIKITRDAELDLEQDVTKSIVKKVSESIKNRRKGQPTRLVYDEAMPAEALKFLLKKIQLNKEDQPIAGGRYHNFVDFIRFPSLNRLELKQKNLPVLPHKEIPARTSMFKIIAKQDVLLSFPYQSYTHVINLLREASIDPKVVSISITLYRLANNSRIINSLINAIKNGKKVTAIVELQARFDEEANIRWANKLNDEGVKVIYGVPGIKLHSKLFLISRQEQNKLLNYAHIGTGNFNEDTAKLYADYSLLTADKRITEEVQKVFNFYNDNLKIGTYKHLVVSPFSTRKKYLQLINAEIENARQGHDAWLFLKMNSLTDPEMIKKLYEASAAGVKIRLIIRSICSLVPGINSLSENIEAISIVDKYLEHARVFVFSNNGAPKVYLSSADWMTRNLDHRSEVGVPVYDESLKKQLIDMLEIQWNDNTKARSINVFQNNPYHFSKVKSKFKSQDEIYKYIEKNNA